MIKILIFLLGGLAEAEPLIQEAQNSGVQEGGEVEKSVQQGQVECTEAEARVIVFHWLDEAVDHQDKILQGNIQSQLMERELCFVPVTDLLQKVPASEKEIAAAEKVTGDIENLLKKDVSLDGKEWLDMMTRLKVFAEEMDEVSFAKHQSLQERLFSVYVVAGMIGAYFSDENSTRDWYFTNLSVKNNTNFFIYQATFLLMDNPTKELLRAELFSQMQAQEIFQGQEDFQSDLRGAIGVYEKLIQNARREQRQNKARALTREFYNTASWHFIENIEISKDNRFYLDSYVYNLPAETNKESIYVAIAKHGDPNLVSVWKAGENPNELTIVKEEKRSLEFVLTSGTGVFVGAKTVSTENISAEHFSETETELAEHAPIAIPLELNLRIHYGHWFFEEGISFHKHLAGAWVEYVQTPNNIDENIVTARFTGCFERNSDSGQREGFLNEELLNKDYCRLEGEYFSERSFAKNRYLGLGYVLGEQGQAAKGYGIRVGSRWGMLDMPSSFTGVVQTGYTKPIGEPLRNDGQLVVDVNVQAGIMFARARNLMFDLNQMGRVAPILGLTVSAGTSF